MTQTTISLSELFAINKAAMDVERQRILDILNKHIASYQGMDPNGPLAPLNTSAIAALQAVQQEIEA